MGQLLPYDLAPGLPDMPIQEFALVTKSLLVSQESCVSCGTELMAERIGRRADDVRRGMHCCAGVTQ